MVTSAGIACLAIYIMLSKTVSSISISGFTNLQSFGLSILISTTISVLVCMLLVNMGGNYLAPQRVCNTIDYVIGMSFSMCPIVNAFLSYLSLRRKRKRTQHQ